MPTNPHDALRAWFLGPRAENAELLERLVIESLRDHVFWRRNYHPEDGVVIREVDKRQEGYEEAVATLTQELMGLLAELKRDVPVFSGRYKGHMIGEQTIASQVGYFATMLGTTSRQRTTFDDPALGNARVSSAVQAVVAFYAPVDFATMDAQAADPGGCTQGAQGHDEAGSPESRWLGRPLPSAVATVRAANPLTYLRATPAPPPFFVAHGTQDCNVPHGQSLELVKALKAKGVPQSLTLLDGVGHGGADFAQLQGRVIAFLDRTVGRG